MMLDKFKSIVGHLLLNLHRNCGAEFACRILLSKVISKVLELWCRMWIESKFRQYRNTCDSDLGYKYFVQQKILEFVKNSVTIIWRFLILVKLVQWIFLEIGMN